jgi:peptidoglycan/LPS O-acetylase OafA/YrhL
VVEAEETRRRIASVDGLRALAVLGVVWFHVWQAFGNIPWTLPVGPHHLSLNEPLSIGQTGVDLFFVISGFCMYLMYARKQSVFTWRGYGDFLQRRLLRIGPAYYAALVFFSIGFLLADGHLPLRNLLANALWLPSAAHHGPDYPAPFWSLSVEWGFYIILPVLVWGSWRFGFVRTVTVIAVASLLFRLAAFTVFRGSHGGVWYWNWATLPPTCLAEFVPGLVVARLYTTGRQLPSLLSGYGGIAAGLLITVTGRLLTWSALSGHVAIVSGVLGLPIMTIGYSVLLWNAVESRTLVQKILCVGPMQVVGRWSYSIYLFHMAAIPVLCAAIVREYGRTPAAQYLALALVLAVVIPGAALSYTLFERPYFLLRSRRAALIAPAPVPTGE